MTGFLRFLSLFPSLATKQKMRVLPRKLETISNKMAFPVANKMIRILNNTDKEY